MLQEQRCSSATTQISLFVLWLKVQVNNFSVMSGWSQRILGLSSTVGSKCVLLKDIKWCRLWRSNPGSLDLESNALTLGHHPPFTQI